MFGKNWNRPQLDVMIKAQAHRGPDAVGVFVSPSGVAGLGHNRLSIIDLSNAGRQPMSDSSGRYWIIFNGEIYNYLELRTELEATYSFHTKTDTEVLLAAWLKWGESCLNRLIGMFAYVIWDETNRKVFGARDRFGVKPLHYHVTPGGELWLASEIKALHAAGVPRRSDQATWATYLVSGMYDHSDDTFWEGIKRIPPGGCFSWTLDQGLSIRQWYDVATAAVAAGPDLRDDQSIADELLALLEETVRLRFRADVPVGICLSGGLDSSLLLGLVHRIYGADSAVKTFTFYCGDPAYDELPWVEQMLAETKHPACFCRLDPNEVPGLAARVQTSQDEPYGGIPTLGMSKVHERAVQVGVVVLLDGNGLDEGWAGYEYYQRAARVDASQAPVQGSRDRSTRPDCLNPDFAALAKSLTSVPPPPSSGSDFSSALSPLQSIQYRDLRHAKIPRAMRFADRVSMMHSRELREPFLDHRIIELGLRQPRSERFRTDRGNGWCADLPQGSSPTAFAKLPNGRSRLRSANGCGVHSCRGPGSRSTTRSQSISTGSTRTPCAPALAAYLAGHGDNSFAVWQWTSSARKKIQS